MKLLLGALLTTEHFQPPGKFCISLSIALAVCLVCLCSDFLQAAAQWVLTWSLCTRCVWKTDSSSNSDFHIYIVCSTFPWHCINFSVSHLKWNKKCVINACTHCILNSSFPVSQGSATYRYMLVTLSSETSGPYRFCSYVKAAKSQKYIMVLFVPYSSSTVEKPPESFKRTETLKACYQGTK